MGTLVFQATLGGAINLIGPNTASTVNFTLPSADGTSGQALTTNGSGTLAFTTVTSTPGGSTTQVQYNNAGVFAGSANLTFNGTTLTAANTSITTSETLSYGTANGVTYLNGSKVLTSGSALVFDGTNLGVGVTPSAWGSGSNAVQNTAGSIWRYGTDYIYLGQNYYFNGTNRIYSTTAAATEYRQGLGSHIFYTAPSGTAGNTISFTDRLTITSTGAVIAGLISASTTGQVGTTLGVGGATPSASGSGITFPATQSASSDANTLDDYEEGTWTPVYTPNAGSFTTATYQSQIGFYQKIGNTVHIQAYLYLNGFSLGTATGTLFLTGLPFTSVGSSSYQSGTVGYTYNWATNSPTRAIVYQGESRFYLVRDAQGVTDSSPEITVSNLKNGNPACILGLAISYRVA